MKATGIIRRIDDLGRIVIPKEIRKNLRIGNNESVEIYVENETIILKKYSIEKKLIDFASDFTDAVNKTTKHNIIITDTDTVISSSGKYKQYLNQKISDELINSIKRRENMFENHKKEIEIIDNEKIECTYIIKSILLNGDVVGLIVIFNEKENLLDIDLTIASMITLFLNKYLEK